LRRAFTGKNEKMNSHFQSLFENVCRCFGHTPTSRGTAGESVNNSVEEIDGDEHNRQSILTVNSEASSIAGKRRTNGLKLNDKQYDELFDKVQRANNKPSKQVNGQPPRQGEKRNKNENNMTGMSDHDTAQALAKAKLAANPPRYRQKRKRPSQTREEIFRNKNGKNTMGSAMGSASCMNVGGDKSSTSGSSRKDKASAPKSDFSRLLNPSLALCFATPIRGTEEEQEEQDLKSLDHSDTATLNTNGDDTITSTLYFDSKYAHIQESTPPMPLFSQFKIGQAKDEIRNIMATDSHSSVRMIKIMEQNEQVGRRGHEKRTSTTSTVIEGTEGGSSSNGEMEQQPQNTSRRVESQSPVPDTKGTSRRKETIKITSDAHVRDEEMEDAVPDVKPLSSSTDSSRFSNNATRQATIQ